MHGDAVDDDRRGADADQQERRVALVRVDDEGEDGDRGEQPRRQPPEDGV